MQVVYEPSGRKIEFDGLGSRLREALHAVNGAAKYFLLPLDETDPQSAPAAVVVTSDDNLTWALASAETCIAMRRKPYDSWEQFFPTFLTLWKTFVTEIGVEKLTDLVVRYTNQMDIGVGGAPSSLEDLLTIYPVLANVKAMTTDRSSLTQRLLDDDVDFEISLSNSPDENGARRILLDLRARATKQLIGTIEEHDVTGAVERLHVRIDDVFNACITQPTREFLL